MCVVREFSKFLKWNFFPGELNSFLENFFTLTRHLSFPLCKLETLFSFTYLEWDAEERYCDVSEGQVGDVEVGDVVHGPGGGHDADDERVAADGHQGDGAVAQRQQNQHGYK